MKPPLEVKKWLSGSVTDEDIRALVELSNKYADCTPGDGGPGPTELYIALCMQVGACIPELIESAVKLRGLTER